MRSYRSLMWLVCGVLLCAGLTGPEALAKSTAQGMAEGATVLATMRLKEDPKNEGGKALLRFALFVDPENEGALLLQAKLERNHDLKDVALADGGRKYVGNLKRIIRKTRSTSKRLLLYKVIETILPDDTEALLELTRAKNKGIDTSFDSLYSSISGGSKPEPDSEKPKEKPDTTGKPDPRKVLKDVTLSSSYLSTSSPVDTINYLSRAVHPHGITVAIAASKLPVRTYFDSSTGAPRYYSNVNLPPQPTVYRSASSTAEVSAEEMLRRVCLTFQLGYKFEPGKVVITDPDDAGAVETIGLVRKATALSSAFSEEASKSVREYRGKLIAISGDISGIGKSMSTPYVHLEKDRVRVTFARSVAKDKIAQLKAAYEDFNDRDGASSYSSSYERCLQFFGSARCKGLSSGRVVLTDCEDFSWHTMYRRKSD